MLERNSRGSLKRMDDKMAVRNGLIVRLKKAKEFLEEEKDDAEYRAENFRDKYASTEEYDDADFVARSKAKLFGDALAYHDALFLA